MLIRKQIQSGNHYLGHTVHNKESELRKKKKKKRQLKMEKFTEINLKECCPLHNQTQPSTKP
jgi:hypothetical protein